MGKSVPFFEKAVQNEASALVGTWATQTQAKVGWYDWVDIFWQTPLSSGFREVTYPGDIHQRLWSWLRGCLKVIDRLGLERFSLSAPTWARKAVVQLFRSVSWLISVGVFLKHPTSTYSGGFGRKLQLREASKQLKLTPRGSSGQFSISGLRVSGVPGPMDKGRWNHNHLKYAQIAQDLKPFLLGQNKIITEIGSGFGGLIPELELLRPNLRSTYVLVDLYSSLLVAEAYLEAELQVPILRCFPSEYPETNLDMMIAEHHKSSTVVILAPPESFLQSSFAPDITVNSESFMEMTSEAVGQYFRRMETSPNLLFYNRNRAVRIEGNERRFFEDFPYDKNWSPLEAFQCRYSVAISDEGEPIIVRISQR